MSLLIQVTESVQNLNWFKKILCFFKSKIFTVATKLIALAHAPSKMGAQASLHFSLAASSKPSCYLAVLWKEATKVRQ